MKIPFPLRLHARRGLLVYQLALILIAVIILILVLLYFARRNQTGTTSPATGADTTAAVSTTHPSASIASGRRVAT